MKRLLYLKSIRWIRILVLCVLFSSLKVSAQNNIVLQTRVSLQFENKTLKEVLEYLHHEYDLNFSYSDNVLPSHSFKSLSYKDTSIEVIIADLLTPFALEYQIIDGQVVVYPKAEKEWFVVSGYIGEAGSKENLIGATVYDSETGIGTVTNAYGYYAIKLPQGIYNLQYTCMGYKTKKVHTRVTKSFQQDIELLSISYDVSEVVVSIKQKDEFIESALNSLTHLDISTLQDMPGLFGENDALRNLSLLPGIQSNELSTGNVFVRGGSTDQTLYLMDEAILYNASHFGGFFSVFNPDVVNSVNVYKSDAPLSEGGALSSLIDVRLRDGNLNKWKYSGGLGLVSARLSAEGPIVKDRSSVLIAFRRTYVDQVLRLLATDASARNLRFYFYDANFKANVKINKKNRLYLSGYSGSDSFKQISELSRANHLFTLRWNHLFNSNLFSNASLIFSRNLYQQSLLQNQEDILWRSQANNFKFKYDFSHYLSDKTKLTYGYSASYRYLVPYALFTDLENPIFTEVESDIEQQLQSSLYFQQQTYLAKRLYLIGGARVTHVIGEPLAETSLFNWWMFEPMASISFRQSDNAIAKISYSRKTQPVHQLLLSTVGVNINRWFPANNDFHPQISNNYSMGYFKNVNPNLELSAEVYYRKMENLIEPMQEMRILYAENPENYLYRSSGEAMGIELSSSFTKGNFRGQANYEYSRVLWTTIGLNENKPYPASHVRAHSFSCSGVYAFNNRVTASATWQLSSGNPFTAATGKYTIDGKTYLKFDKDKINTQRLPLYHRLDLSIDVAGKNNDKRRYKSFWNFSIYNAYMHKNVLGVVYFTSVKDNQPLESQVLNPSYFYLYQFVPSISYQFKF